MPGGGFGPATVVSLTLVLDGELAALEYALLDRLAGCSASRATDFDVPLGEEQLQGKQYGATRELAVSLKDQADTAWRNGDAGRAETLYRQAIKTDPACLPARSALGFLLRSAGRLTDALACYDAAARIAPRDAEIHLGRGVTLTALGRYAHAIHAFDFAQRHAPAAAEPPINKAVALALCGRHEEAIGIWTALLERNPGLAPARLYRAFSWLLMGRMKEGFAEHEARLHLPGVVPHDLLVGRKAWDGSPLHGRTLLIYPEQGMGDMIQFLRYARAAKARGARTMVVCHAPLVRLLRAAEGIDVVVPDDGTPLPEDFDVYLALMSLPHLFSDLPVPGPLPLDVPPAPLDCIAGAPGLKVGLCWQGNRQHDRDAERSIPPAAFWKALNGVEGVSYFSLQIEDRSGGHGLSLAPHIRDFHDTAALVQQLDLVVTVDTSVAHLSGSLGVPTWMLVTFSPDWRWGLEGEATHWYPGMRIFRQPQPGSWEAALRKVREALVHAAAGGA